MSDDLIKRLRNLTPSPHYIGMPVLDPANDLAITCFEAAAALAEAQAEIARLTARADRMEAALRDIAKQKTTEEIIATEDIGMCDFEGGYDAIIGVARAALTDKPDAGKGE